VDMDGAKCSVYEFDFAQFSAQQKKACIEASATALSKTAKEIEQYFEEGGEMYILTAFVSGSPISRV